MAFRRRYYAELLENVATVDALKKLRAERRVMFVFAARDVERNGAVVLWEFLLRTEPPDGR